MDLCTLVFMVLFLVLDAVDLIIDGIFHDNVKSNPENVLTQDDANNFKAPIFTFLIVGSVAVVINIGIFTVTFISNRGIAYKEEEIKVPLYMSALITWFEDLPQIAICLILAFKVDSWLNESVQLTKAIFTVVKAMIYLVYLCMTKTRYEAARLWLYKLDFIGNVILLLSDIILLTRLGSFNM